jgi:hypothetical protein
VLSLCSPRFRRGAVAHLDLGHVGSIARWPILGVSRHDSELFARSPPRRAGVAELTKVARRAHR